MTLHASRTLPGLFVHPSLGSAFLVERFCFVLVVPLHTIFTILTRHYAHLLKAWGTVMGRALSLLTIEEMECTTTLEASATPDVKCFVWEANKVFDIGKAPRHKEGGSKEQYYLLGFHPVTEFIIMCRLYENDIRRVGNSIVR